MLLRPLLPDAVLLASMPPLLADPGRLLPLERAQVANAVDKRQREYAAGRQLFRQLLAGRAEAAAPLINDTDRVPLWPAGIVGAITHCDTLCAVALASSNDTAGLGIDLEPARPLPVDVHRLVLREAEHAGLRDLPPAWRELGATLTFCAKEALYKALYPSTREFLDFQQVELRWQEDRFSAQVFSATHPACTSQPLEGRVACDGQHVAAAVQLVRRP
ncbi:4'-phosphopantetheinyl transferase family protein [Stenotrophomonas sp. LGBM10]|uniref:4'-phosphopantetheinyl transferase family protein n=1 Tax=Stenotrophomonas sp. LGBM10 TaxID=3390038 RepID=UPI00398A5E3E